MIGRLQNLLPIWKVSFCRTSRVPRERPQKLLTGYQQAAEVTQDRALNRCQKQRWTNLVYKMARRLALATEVDLTYDLPLQTPSTVPI